MRVCCAVLLFVLLLAACAHQEVRKSVAGNCEVITHDLTNRPNRTIQDSSNFTNDDPGDDFKDLDASLMHVPTEYELTLNVGEKEPSTIHAVVDTGSANLIVQHQKCDGCSGTLYNPNPDQATGYSFDVHFGSGEGYVREYEDSVGFSCGAPVPFTIGVLTQNKNLPNILGLAYQSISQPVQKPLPPFFDVLVQKGAVADLFSMTLCGYGKKSQIILGDNNHKVDLRQLQYAPIVEESYYVLPFKTLRIKGKSQSLGAFPTPSGTNPRTILDSGTTINLLPPALFQALLGEIRKVGALPEAYFTTTDPHSDNYAMAISDDVIARYPTLQVEVGAEDGSSFWLDITPQTYFKRLNGTRRLFGFRPWTGVPAYMMGQVLMENYYVVFDRANRRVGFGPLLDLCQSP